MKKDISTKKVIKKIAKDIIRYILKLNVIDCEQMLKIDKPESLVLAVLCDFKGKEELLYY